MLSLGILVALGLLAVAAVVGAEIGEAGST